MRAYLASQGVKVPEKVGKGRIGNLNFNITDPDGHTVEIVQYAPDGWTAAREGEVPARHPHLHAHDPCRVFWLGTWSRR